MTLLQGLPWQRLPYEAFQPAVNSTWYRPIGCCPTTAPEWLIMITNFKDFVTHSMMEQDEMMKLWNASSLGIQMIVCSDYSYLGASFEQIPKFIRSQALAGLLGVQLSDQDIFKQRFMSNEKSLEAFEYYFALDHQHVKIKIPQ